MFSWDIIGLAAAETAKISLPTIWDALRSRTNYRACNERLDSWSKRILAQAEVQLQVLGREHITPGASYVVMSNHQSHYDIPVLFQALKLPLRMVAKTELFRIPVMGKAMSDSGFIELDRSNRKRSIESLRRARSRLLDDHLSIWIAPEGTRSMDGVLGRFKTGGFHLAIDAGVPILPVAIDGTHKIHRSGDWGIHRERSVSVTIAPPIDVSGFAKGDIPALSERVRQAIALPLGQT